MDHTNTIYIVSRATNSNTLAPHIFAMHQHAGKKVKLWTGSHLVDTCPRNTTDTIIILFTILKIIIHLKYHIKLQNNLIILYMQLTNFHALTIKHLDPTNFKGSRIKITSDRFSQSITLNRDYSKSSWLDQAIMFLTQNWFNLIGSTEYNNQTIILSDTFKPLK